MKHQKILLSNGCSCSNPSVFPKDWKTCGKSSLKKEWRIQYYFYDPNFPKPKTPIMVKGMNSFKTLEERRKVTQSILKDELDALINRGYNPYLKKYMIEEPEKPKAELHPDLPIIDAFRGAMSKLSKLKENSKEHLEQIGYALNRFEKAAVQLRMTNIRIYDFKRSQLKVIFEHLNLTNDYFNKFKTYFSSLFKELIEWECCETNITRDIQKRVIIRNQREVLSKNDVELILDFLKPDFPTFHRYGYIFFYSASRSRELFTVQAKHVRLQQQEYDVLIKKGKQYVWETKVIIKNAIPFWTEIMELVKSPDDFLFSHGLIPGPIKNDSKQITIRWKDHVKKKLAFYNGQVRKIQDLKESGITDFENITADFYSMKHTFLDLLDEMDNFEAETSTATEMAAHRKSKTTAIYTTGRVKRKNEKLKKIRV